MTLNEGDIIEYKMTVRGEITKLNNDGTFSITVRDGRGFKFSGAYEWKDLESAKVINKAKEKRENIKKWLAGGDVPIDYHDLKKMFASGELVFKDA